MKPGDIVEVIWDDHQFQFGEYAGDGITTLTTVGYFVRSDRDVIAVALSRREDGKFHEVQVIDRRMVRRVRRWKGEPG